MIKVQFKNNYENVFGGKEYTYKDFEGIEVGDIVVANTSCGFAIARVTQIDVEDYRIDFDRLASIEKIILTQKDIEKKEKEKYEKRKAMVQFVRDAKRKILTEQLANFAEEKNNKELLNSLENEDLEKLYNCLFKE